MSRTSETSDRDSQRLRVTVIIPCHNHADMVDDAVQSAINQQGENFTLSVIVIDDGSTDNPEEALKHWQEQEFENIHFLRNEQPTGPSAARNKAAKHMWEESDVFMMLDADDLYLPGKITKSVEKFLEDPMRIGIVYTDAVIKNLNTGTEIQEYRQPFDREALEKECIISNTPLVNKVAFAEAGGYDEEMRTCEDWDLWLRMTENYVAVQIPETLHVYHVTGRNSTDVVPEEVWQQNWTRIRQKMTQRANVK